MIPYEDLVAALASWRTRNGLPTGHADYLGEPPAPEPVNLEAYQPSPAEEEVVDLSEDSLEDAVLEEADASGVEEAPYAEGAPIEEGVPMAAEIYAEEAAPAEEIPGAYADLQEEAGGAYEEAPLGEAAPPEPIPEDAIYGETDEGFTSGQTQDEIAMSDAPQAPAEGEGFPLGESEATDIANAADFAPPDEPMPVEEAAPVPDGTSQMWPPSGEEQPEEAPLAEPPPVDEPPPADPDGEPPQQ